MGEAKRLYDERQELKRERQAMENERARLRQEREGAAEKVADLAIAALTAFLTGKARLSIEPGNHEGTQMVHFVWDERPAVLEAHTQR